MTNVLIIDDSPEMGHLFQEMARLLGYRAEVTAGAIDGLASVRAAEPDVILLDIMMPDMNGWQVYEELRLFSSVPIIFLTADYSSANRLRASELGVRMIRKNVTPLELRGHIEAALQTLPD